MIINSFNLFYYYIIRTSKFKIRYGYAFNYILSNDPIILLHRYCTSAEEKIIFNSIFKRSLRLKKEPQNTPLSEAKFKKHLVLGLLENEPSKNSCSNTKFSNVEKDVKFPYAFAIKPDTSNNYSPCDNGEGVKQDYTAFTDREIIKSPKWMNDYEHFCKPDENQFTDDLEINYGTPDPSIPISNVVCGGCGSFMQCQEPSIPGYLPSEIFLECSINDLKTLLCQRCHFLKKYDVALSVQVDSLSYVNLLSRMKENSLVILMVDLTDFPCSIWPGIIDIIGRQKPIFIVGNKVDLLWRDSYKWLKRVENLLRISFPDYANILHLCLISAKTGFGVEDLITKLHSIWNYKGDVYLLGCTNVGKSTLFNALLRSDYCKSKAVDLVQRATTAPWPGTTLNLLKFPILKPAAWRIFIRNSRLNEERKQEKAERQLQKLQSVIQKKKIRTPLQLIGNITHTFAKTNSSVKPEEDFSIPTSAENAVTSPISMMNTKFPEFEEGKWFYDTPGVMHQDQILDLLTAEELIVTIPKEIIEPRTFLVKCGWSLFIAGLARMDYISGNKSVRCTVFSSKTLPVTICNTEDAEETYQKLLGSAYFRVPFGDTKRLVKWPGLEAASSVILSGISENESCGDLLCSSAGWIAVAPENNEVCKFRIWTPMKRGQHIRCPSLLPFAVQLHGKRLNRSPAYDKTRPFTEI